MLLSTSLCDRYLISTYTWRFLRNSYKKLYYHIESTFIYKLREENITILNNCYFWLDIIFIIKIIFYCFAAVSCRLSLCWCLFCKGFGGELLLKLLVLHQLNSILLSILFDILTVWHPFKWSFEMFSFSFLVFFGGNFILDIESIGWIPLIYIKKTTSISFILLVFQRFGTFLG